MNLKIICVVEGHGEVQALPVLIRRILQCANVQIGVDIPEPIRTKRDRFINKQDEYQKVLRLAAAKARGAPILILLDADDDCPVMLSRQIEENIRNTVGNINVGVVIANREFESWFLASVTTLVGQRKLEVNLTVPSYSEDIRNCKGWLSERMTYGYREILDQAAFANSICPSLATMNSRSFEKFSKEVMRLLGLPNTFSKLAT
jgi:hypothetical protein